MGKDTFLDTILHVTLFTMKAHFDVSLISTSGTICIVCFIFTSCTRSIVRLYFNVHSTVNSMFMMDMRTDVIVCIHPAEHRCVNILHVPIYCLNLEQEFPAGSDL
jgi:hypothetical protein